MRTVTSDADGVMIHSVDVRGAVVEAVSVLKIKMHGEEAVATGKSDATWYRGVLATFLIPKVETLLEARTAAGDIMVSTMLAQ